MLKIYPRIVFALLFTPIYGTLFSQSIGISTSGSTPSVNAILDLNSGNKYKMGLVIPHVTLGASLTTFSPPIINAATVNDTGMMVYNMNGPQAVGYYYWNGTTWANVTLSGGGGGNVNACNSAATGYIPYFILPSVTLCNSFIYQSLTGQIGIGNSAPASSAVVDLTNTKATGGTGAPLVWPTNPNPSANITVPVLGEEIFNTTSGCFDFYNGTTWLVTGCPCTTVPATPTITPSCSQSFQGSTITYTSSVTTGVTFSWTVTATTGTPIVTGNGASSITVTWPNSVAGTGTVKLTLVNMCGTTTASLPVTISNPTISGFATAFTNNTANYSVSIAGATYAWSFSSNTNGSSIVGSSTNQSVSILAGAAAGTFALQCIVTLGSCSATATYNVTVNTCGTITLDNFVAAPQQTSTFNITTNGTNEVVLVMANGIGNAAFTGSVSVNGGAVTVTTILNSDANKTTTYVNQDMVGFIATTAATYTIAVTETPGNTKDYNNSAVALYGFCGTPTIALNVTAATHTTATAQTMSISNPITPTVTNSYIIANYYNDNDIQTGFGTITWTAPAGNVLLGTDDNNTASLYADGSVAGYSDATTGAVTFTVQDENGATKNVKVGELQCVDVHN